MSDCGSHDFKKGHNYSKRLDAVVQWVSGTIHGQEEWSEDGCDRNCMQNHQKFGRGLWDVHTSDWAFETSQFGHWTQG